MPLTRHRAAGPLPAMTSRADIQGLRALAVLFVVLGHAGLLGVTGGYVGVDVFFVLSGFLITSILLHEATRRGSLSLVGFYAKRARRILPAATLALIGTAIAATVIVPYVRAEAILKDVAWSALFAANIHFGDARTDYFAANQPPSPVQHYWSLAVEEQFYLVWPALIVGALIVGARRSPSTVRRRVPALAIAVAVLSVLSLVWSIAQTQTHPAAAYFSTPARCWELGTGALLAFFGQSLPRLSKRLRSLVAAVGLGMVLTAGFTFTEATPVPGYHMLLPVLGTVALIAAGSGSTEATRPAVVRLLGKQPLRWIGDVSYGFYLWHWPFLILGQAYVGHSLDLTTRVALIGGALMLAWISYELLENPIRRAQTLSLRPKLALLMCRSRSGAWWWSTSARTPTSATSEIWSPPRPPRSTCPYCRSRSECRAPAIRSTTHSRTPWIGRRSTFRKRRSTTSRRRSDHGWMTRAAGRRRLSCRMTSARSATSAASDG